MFSIETKKSRYVAVECLCDFIECAVHAFLRSRNIYPKESFGTHMRFGLTVQLCNVKRVRQYIKQICHSLQTLMLYDRVNALIVATNQERFVVEVPCDFSKSVFNISEGQKSDLDVRCACTKIFHDTLIHIYRKLDHMREGLASDMEWEVTADVKRNQSQTSELMDMPSGWLMDNRNRSNCKTRLPLKSSTQEDTTFISVYLDSKEESVVTL
jgi:hypothetical protein